MPKGTFGQDRPATQIPQPPTHTTQALSVFSDVVVVYPPPEKVKLPGSRMSFPPPTLLATKPPPKKRLGGSPPKFTFTVTTPYRTWLDHLRPTLPPDRAPDW